MKLHQDPTPELADLAKTRYQRYVLYRLESSAAASPWRYIGAWILLVVPMHIRSASSGILEHGWYTAVMTFIAGFSIAEIYFSRAVLSMLRGRDSKEEKIDQQGEAGQPPLAELSRTSPVIWTSAPVSTLAPASGVASS